MTFKEKINNFKGDLSKNKQKASGLTLNDASVIYRRFLKRLPDISHLKNIVLFGGLSTLFIFILFAQRFNALSEYIPTKPVVGGVYSEGLVGKIEQLNPLFAPVNSAESAAVSLIFSGLTKKDGGRNNIPDLAEKWEISEDGKTYTFHLRDNLIWQDGGTLKADDVVFTVNTIQNPDVRSPLLDVWKDVEVVAADEKTVVFKLKNVYAPFIDNTDLPIIPRHILETVPARNLRVAEFSAKPIGSGPFKFESLKKVKENEELTLVASDAYYSARPYIQKVILKTYPNDQKMVAGYTKKEVIGIEKVPSGEYGKTNLPNINQYQISIPEYDVLYFNLRTGLTKDKNFRDAISLALSREGIATEVYRGEALSINGPILPGYLGYAKSKATYNPEEAKAKLAAAGWTPDADGILKNVDSRAKVRLLSSDSPEKVAEADYIEASLKPLGIEVAHEIYPMGALVQDHIRPRDFDLLLISQNLGGDSDIYSFWHSSGLNDPGLNFSGLSDRALDKYLEQARTSLDSALRIGKYQAAQKIISDNNPAQFLLWPSYLYGVSKEVKGIENERLIDPANRFWNITSWYIESKQAYR